MLKAFFVGLVTELYNRVWLSYRSTILGIAVTAIGEALNYTLNTVPDPRIHAACALLTTIFIAWKEKKVKDGAVKLLVFFLFVTTAAHAQGSPAARAHAAAEMGANPDALGKAISEDPNAVQPSAPQMPTPSKFGGCSKSGLFCFGPSVSVSMLALNLSTHKVEGAFSPGIGYGFTYRPGSWDSIGADVHFVLDPGAQQASASVIVKLINGYFRIGVSKGFVGDTGLRLPVGFGVDL